MVFILLQDSISLSNLGLVVLRHDLILNPNIRDYCLDIYRIPSTNEGAIKHISRLCLPPLTEGVFASGVDCCATPNPTGGGVFPRHIPSTVPFVNRPQNAIILFTWVFSYKFFLLFPFSMIVHRQSVVDLLPAECEWFTSPYHTTDWNDWGPPKCHWIFQPQSTYITVTNGQRYVKYDASEGFGPGSLTVLDFNKQTTEHACANRSLGTCLSSELVHPVFAETILRNLPYLQITTQANGDYTGVMMNDNAIVGMHVRSESTHSCLKTPHS